MKNSILWGALLILALILSACGASATPTELPMTLEPTQPPIADTAVATKPPAATDTAVTEVPTLSVPVTGAASVQVSESSAGPILVNSEGFSLYMFTNDAQNSGTSACTGDCLTSWPPLLIQGTPSGGEGVDAALLGTIQRDDGTMQVTYNGWPLYLYSGDKVSGDVNGQGVGGKWHLVSPGGQAIQ